MTDEPNSKRYRCTRCGGFNVLQDAYVHVNDPDDVRVFDNFYCETCEGECSISEGP